MQLKLLDEKIIAHLSENAREPITKTAKSLGITRDQAEYRINNYFSSGLIKHISPVIDYKALGYEYFTVLLIKLSDIRHERTFLNSLEKHKNCIAAGTAYNKYDLYANLVFKNEKNAREKISQITGSSNISHYKIIRPFFSELYPLKIIHDKEPIKLISDPSESKPVSPDKKDLQILKILSNDARTKITEIANRLGISAELALHRLRKLYSKNIIQGYRIHFDYSKFQKFFSIILLDLKDFSDKTVEKLKKYSRNSDISSSASLCLSAPNAIIQIFHKDQYELRSELKKLKKLFRENLTNIDVLLIEGEEKANILPFI